LTTIQRQKATENCRVQKVTAKRESN